MPSILAFFNDNKSAHNCMLDVKKNITQSTRVYTVAQHEYKEATNDTHFAQVQAQKSRISTKVGGFLGLLIGVAFAVAVPRYNDQHKVHQLLAYIVLKPGARDQFERDLHLTKAIKAELENDMMSYMMPSRFIYRESLPITPNGKIDIKALIAEVNSQ